ncbi:YceD family protein [Chenggangzhangella methanolivorans]|uniref:DUF177 domain-containing protein n=1 Tax=Chenggangzhangella methanolivorans TaxID=1437009 RepID=A0A9E6R9T3_9HYPH|nr:DUF177 domain-containing protein [Chenggangzhangella methanolivorans]QZN99453.1 DUF177 domain-containing protein [Chenggangzhangella methanolivorans]
MTPSPISRPLSVATVPPEGLTVEIIADAAERESLAAANDLPSVGRFTARLEARPVGRDGLRVTGRVEAQAERTCVVSLEPFVETIREDVDVRFSPEGAPALHEGEDADPPDQIVNGEVDLGAVACEFFTLGLDPHPRKPGVAFDAAAHGAEAESPFAALKALKDGAQDK